MRIYKYPIPHQSFTSIHLCLLVELIIIMAVDK